MYCFNVLSLLLLTSPHSDDDVRVLYWACYALVTCDNSDKMLQLTHEGVDPNHSVFNRLSTWEHLLTLCLLVEQYVKHPMSDTIGGVAGSSKYVRRTLRPLAVTVGILLVEGHARGCLCNCIQ